MDMSPRGGGRLTVSIVVLALLGFAAWRTMEPGQYQKLTFLLLAFFALRIVLGRSRSR